MYNIDGIREEKWLTIDTPWGKPSDQILEAKINDKYIYFLPRHGRGHKINPSNINFRANIDALKQLGVTDALSMSAVGSLKNELEPGRFVLVDQFIDRTFARVKTFFDKEIVAHVSMAKPTSQGLIKACEKALLNLKLNYKIGGTYLVMEGPQFSSLAESNLYRSWGCDVIGMTNMPEAKLAREDWCTQSAPSVHKPDVSCFLCQRSRQASMLHTRLSLSVGACSWVVPHCSRIKDSGRRTATSGLPSIWLWNSSRRRAASRSY